MKILIGCESSGTVREAFRKRGHDAWSCDIQDADDGSKFHVKGDVLDVMQDDWDLGIFHPPCTYLASSGLHWNTRRPERQTLTDQAVEFFLKFTELKYKWAIENPVGCMSKLYRKPDQYINPFEFGHSARKKTALWLNGLEPLQPTQIIPPISYHLGKSDTATANKKIEGHTFHTFENPAPYARWSNQTPTGQNNLGPSAERWKLRSKTYQGIADAMAETWG